MVMVMKIPYRPTNFGLYARLLSSGRNRVKLLGGSLSRRGYRIS